MSILQASRKIRKNKETKMFEKYFSSFYKFK